MREVGGCIVLAPVVINLQLDHPVGKDRKKLRLSLSEVKERKENQFYLVFGDEAEVPRGEIPYDRNNPTSETLGLGKLHREDSSSTKTSKRRREDCSLQQRAEVQALEIRKRHKSSDKWERAPAVEKLCKPEQDVVKGKSPGEGYFQATESGFMNQSPSEQDQVNPKSLNEGESEAALDSGKWERASEICKRGERVDEPALEFEEVTHNQSSGQLLKKKKVISDSEVYTLEKKLKACLYDDDLSERFRKFEEASRKEMDLLRDSVQASEREAVLLRGRVEASETEAVLLRGRVEASETEAVLLREKVEASETEAVLLRERVEASDTKAVLLRESSEKVEEQLRLELEEVQKQLMFVDGEFFFVVDILENLHTLLSYALQREVALKLQHSTNTEKRSYFGSFPDQTLHSLTYGYVLGKLLSSRNRSRNAYVAELERLLHFPSGPVFTGGFEDELIRAEQRVASKLCTSWRALKLTVAIHLFEIKPDRNHNAHKHQIHPPVQWRGGYDGRHPAPTRSIETCLEAPPTNAPSLSAREDVHSLQLIKLARSRMRATIGEHRYERMDTGVIDAVFGLVEKSLARNVASKLSNSLTRTGSLPLEFRMLQAKKLRRSRGWDLWLRDDSSFRVRLSGGLHWYAANSAEIRVPFSGWPQLG